MLVNPQGTRVVNLWHLQTRKSQRILPSVQHERNSTNTRMMGIVHSELSSSQVLIPVIMSGADVVPHHVLEESVSPLSLAICLWMECSRHL
jgi:hypothetical protein